MQTEKDRVKRLAKDLTLRLLGCFGISIAYGLIMLRVFHHGTPNSMGETCGEITAGLALATLILWPPAYLTHYFQDRSTPDDE